MKKSISKNSLICLVLFVSMFLGGSAQAATTTQSIAFPMYEYPTIGTLWSDIRTAGSQVPWIIADPDSGPGVSVNSDYTTALNNLPVGQRAVGYVHTNYQARSIATVLDDVDTWYQMYPQISGIFVDLVQNGDADDLCYGATLHNYIKSKHPNDLTIFNFGQNVEARYEPYGDIFGNSENTYAVYSAWTPFTDGFENSAANANRFWHIVHTASAGQMTSALNLTRANNAGWVLVTNNTMPNPYTSVPSYWSTFLTDVATLPQSTIPNRGLTALPASCLDLSLATNTSATTGTKQVNHTVTNTVTNDDSSRVSWGSTTLTYDVPNGATLSALDGGVDWDCVVADQSCSYNGDLAAGASLPAVNAALTVGCDYTSGSASVTLQNFANNTATAQASLTKPTDCLGASTTTSNSSPSTSSTPAKKKVAVAAPTTPSTDSSSEPVTTTTTEPTITTAGPTPHVTTESEKRAQPARSHTSLFIFGGSALAVLIGGVWIYIVRRRS